MPLLFSVSSLFLGITLATTPTARAQDAASQPVNAVSLLGQLSVVISSGVDLRRFSAPAMLRGLWTAWEILELSL
jgi:hypothetical protein